MRVPRLFVEQPLGEGQSIEIAAERAHYLRNVLRLRTGASVDLFNGRSGEWRATMAGIDRRRITLEIGAQRRPQADESGPVLLFAPIRRNRLEWMLEKAVELGVHALVPVVTEHAVVELGRPDRLRARLIEAAEQCGRLTVPEIGQVVSLEDVIERHAELVVADERRDGQPLLAALEDRPDSPLLVGPEGGFSDAERRLLADAGARFTTLGPLVLRAETAALFVLAAWRALESDVEDE
ncbi:MAG: 16S rRNA (uracil(1498)-N(3))-methyltransferase [Geminicoccaceae bacterium]|nr:16S rRNA (uracil(1498)-N(3))-methyltransferase [Geminicoccaceae bacterium]